MCVCVCVYIYIEREREHSFDPPMVEACYCVQRVCHGPIPLTSAFKVSDKVTAPLLDFSLVLTEV